MSIRALLAIAFLSSFTVGTTGCVRISATRFESTGHPGVPVDSVRVFGTATPEGGYSEIAVLRTHRFLARDAQVLRALRARAARLGANGLLLLNLRGPGGTRGSGSGVIIGGPGDGTVVVGNVQTEVDEFERAVAIRWRPPVAANPR